MTDSSLYEPPSVWTLPTNTEGSWSNINRPVAGPTHEKPLPVGEHPLQLYSMGTPNGVKVTVMLEELLAAGHSGAEYDAHLIRIGEGDQFGSGFVEVNPNSKIPGLVDRSGTQPQRVFESGAILLYLAEKFDAFLSHEHGARTETLSWLFWQVGSAPFLGGGFGHFYVYAPIKIRYAIDRFTMETKRQLDVLDRRLGESDWLGGNDYSIADIATWPWYGQLVLDRVYGAAEFLQAHQYTKLVQWAKRIDERPAVQRGIMVNRTIGPAETQLHERHHASDFDTQTEDKRAGRTRQAHRIAGS